ncbi:hypothetical protein [Butyrivibrio sp. YAB3001]|uniref:hypothetical protein n=1 Tax=Butyrivibrio sp. YAB3001 TaxID=1520812 RepID=UPI0008F66DB6|nr:hypothetical protein [Butyrivibrio sp. YAB3001]SFB67226.1 hypothetical protein SAMN02910398_00107 [Butyrivibrio sp. YAB3001]
MGLNMENDDVEVKSTENKKKPTKKTKEMLEENANKIEELRQEQDSLSAVLMDLDNEENALGEKSALNMSVTHKKFGEGTVIKQDGKYIEVKFADVVKKFVLPGCIADKFLEVADNDTFEYYVKSNEIHKKRMNTELKIKSATFAIQRHEDAIEKLNAKFK